MRTQAEKTAAFRALHQRPAASSSPIRGMRARPRSWRGWATRRWRPPASASPTSWAALTAGEPRRGDRQRPRDRRGDRPAGECRPGELLCPRAGGRRRDDPAGGRGGLAGGSIEDYSGDPKAPIYDFDLSVERVRAAVAMAKSLPVPFVLTARAENLIRGRNDMADTIRRLKAYAAAGAEVLYAPGLRTAAEIRAVVEAIDRPLNVVTGWLEPGITVGRRGGGRGQAHQRRRGAQPAGAGRLRRCGRGR